MWEGLMGPPTEPAFLFEQMDFIKIVSYLLSELL
jgi:hypothetical protein